MVNNNGIPFEAKKPFETVQELKNEIPSYEEFMKDYKVDENLNYDDLSSGDIGEAKGYGPCYVCSKSTRWTDLYVSCPVSWCSDKDPGYWRHASCSGSRMEVSNKARLRCKSCYTSYQIGCWRFACSTHGGSYEGITRSSFGKALSIVLGSNDCDEVITDLGAYITSPDHRGEWNN